MSSAKSQFGAFSLKRSNDFLHVLTHVDVIGTDFPTEYLKQKIEKYFCLTCLLLHPHNNTNKESNACVTLTRSTHHLVRKSNVELFW